jgi:adenylylsulfate kinase
LPNTAALFQERAVDDSVKVDFWLLRAEWTFSEDTCHVIGYASIKKITSRFAGIIAFLIQKRGPLPMEGKQNNLYWHKPSVTVEDRRESFGYQSCVLWFTGLPSAGKSTLANALCRKLHLIGARSYVLDGDNIRHGLNKDLGFSPEDRKENIRRIGEVARLFVDAGLIVLTAFISPFEEDRRHARSLMQTGEFIEVFLNCSPEVCEQRDPKGMYKKAKAGIIKNFTGVSAPYEKPDNPEIVIDTGRMSIDACVEKLYDYLIQNGYITRSHPNPVTQ